jgi:hypothetical protein
MLAATVIAGCGGGSSGGSTSTVVVTSSGTRPTTSTAHPGHTITTTRGAPAHEPATSTSTGAPAPGSTAALSPSPGGRLLRRYAGHGNARLGTIVVRSPGVLLWSARHRGIQIFTSNGFILVKSGAPSGAIRLSAGTYRGVRVASTAGWSIELRSRSA